MSVYYTNVTERADYQRTVRSSTPIAVKELMGRPPRPEAPMRRVVLDDREDGYYREYQLGRYRSFGQLVMTEEQWDREVRAGYIVLEDGDG